MGWFNYVGTNGPFWRISCSISSHSITPNQEVTKGQLIYKINDAPYVIAHEKAKAQLMIAEKSYDAAKQDMEISKTNHQAFRNVHVGQKAEFATAIYPGKIFSAQVEGIVEATGESQGSLLARETNVRATTGKNVKNKHHFVRLKISEPNGYDIPVGAVGLAWVNAEKPMPFLNFLNVIRGIIIRMKSQIYYIYSM